MIANLINHGTLLIQLEIRPMFRFVHSGHKVYAWKMIYSCDCRFQPSPFFVLDEIDAALDAVNVARIASYIRSCTRGSASDSFQVQQPMRAHHQATGCCRQAMSGT